MAATWSMYVSVCVFHSRRCVFRAMIVCLFCLKIIFICEIFSMYILKQTTMRMEVNLLVQLIWLPFLLISRLLTL